MKIPLILVILAIPIRVGAQDLASPATEVPAAADDSQAPMVEPLMKGDPAPFMGLLVPEERFVELLEAENEARELRAKLAAAERTGELVEKVYLRRLEQATAPLPFYDSVTFNRWLGFGLGLAATALAVWASIEIQEATR